MHCAGKLTLTKRVHGSTLTAGSARFDIEAGPHPTTVAVHLSRAGRAIVRNAGGKGVHVAARAGTVHGTVTLTS
jgi:hypothetical protein